MATKRLSQNIYFTGMQASELKPEPLVPLKPDEIRVKSIKSLISTGTEMICYTRNFDPGTHWERWVRYPFAPGYSLVGEVTELGERVRTVEIGTRVAVRKPHHQFVTVTENDLFFLPENVASEYATFFALAKIVQNGVRRAAHVLGERVVIVGLGLLGQLVVQYLRLSGAREVIAIDFSETRLGLAKESGATTLLKKGVAEAYDEVMDLTHGQGADAVYDVTGAPQVLEQALPLTKRFGTFVLLGDTGRPAQQRLTPDLVTRGLSIVGAHDSNPPSRSSDHAYWDSQQMTQLFFEYLARGDMKASHLVTHRFKPQEVTQAYDLLQNDRMAAMGVVFDWAEL